VKRRSFLTAAGVAPLVGGAISADDHQPELPFLNPTQETVRGDMRYRKLGSTGLDVSCIGLGGHHIGRPKDDDEAIRLVRTAIDAGITFLDNCWDYHDGLSELRMGKALQDGYRRKVVLMTKIDGRTRTEAARQIDQCLLRLRTDHIDLLQHHEVIRLEDPDRIFGPDGAREAVDAAKRAGKVRFVGFTGHKDPVVHLRTLAVAADHRYKFDAVQMPLNVMDAHFRSFARGVVPVLVKEKIGVIGMKSMGDGLVLESKPVTPVECLQYALSLPTSVVVTGIDKPELLKQALTVVKEFKPLSREQLDALVARTKDAAKTGRHELFKTHSRFDSTAKHAEWLG
jgi:predicted aldo/keto reductase-like oxidoreductase